MMTKATNAAKARVNRAIEKMPGALRKRYEKLAEQLAEATAVDVKVRYEIAVVVRDAKDRKKYGDKAVKLLSEALGYSESALYPYAYVAETWTKKELSTLLRRKNVYGDHLSWSHLIELSRVMSKRERNQLIETALEHGLSVRAMMALRDGDRVEDDIEPAQRTAASGLREMVAMSSSLAKKAERWQEDVFASLSGDTPRKLLEDALAATEKLAEVAAKNRQQLKEALKRPRRKRAG